MNSHKAGRTPASLEFEPTFGTLAVKPARGCGRPSVEPNTPTRGSAGGTGLPSCPAAGDGLTVTRTVNCEIPPSIIGRRPTQEPKAGQLVTRWIPRRPVLGGTPPPSQGAQPPLAGGGRAVLAGAVSPDSDKKLTTPNPRHNHKKEIILWAGRAAAMPSFDSHKFACAVEPALLPTGPEISIPEGD